MLKPMTQLIYEDTDRKNEADTYVYNIKTKKKTKVADFRLFIFFNCKEKKYAVTFVDIKDPLRLDEFDLTIVRKGNKNHLEYYKDPIFNRIVNEKIMKYQTFTQKKCSLLRPNPNKIEKITINK
jgi:hypothetical protein